MRVIFSRKGFDSAAGGAPSPIVNGVPRSLPIPAVDRSNTCYADLGLGELVESMTRHRVRSTDLCHNDPMFEDGRCYFGQTGAAQTHLTNQQVGVGDVFLFFGLFANLDRTDVHHRIFGHLRVEQVIPLGKSPCRRINSGLTFEHPHTIGNWHRNNHLYIGQGSQAKSASSVLRLTQAGSNPTLWKVPGWLKHPDLSYHTDPKRWGSGTLQSVSRGQEFVTDITGNESAAQWLAKIIACIEN